MCTPNVSQLSTGLLCSFRSKITKQVEVVNCLLEKCNPNCETDDGIKPLDMTSDPYIRRILIRKGADPFPTDLEVSDTNVKIFILGDPGGGKSTLIQAITTERSIFSLFQRYVKVKDVDERTAGVISYEVETKSLGKVDINDFAGQTEYHASHDEVLYNSMTDSPSVIILVVNVSQSDEKIRDSISYWFHFIQTVRDRCHGSRTPHLWMVGGHADEVRSSTGKQISLLSAVVKNHSFNGIVYQEHIITDCRYAHSSSTSRVRLSISRSCHELRDVEARTIEHHCFLKFLLDTFEDEEGVVLSMVDAELKHKLESDDHTYLERVRSLNSFKMCEKLNERGDILFMRSQSNPGSSWIIFDKATLLSKVNGVIFAPEGFKEYQNLPSNTGVVPLSKLVSLFPDLNSDMITRFLCHLEFCQEIVDSDLKLLLLSHSNTSTERFFFFPCLVCLNRPKLDILIPDSSSNYFKHKSGWVLQCYQSKKFFSVRFLHVLLLRLAFYFTHASDISDSLVVHRRCKVWKTGIQWANRSGSEAIVDVFDLKRVVVIVCSRDEKMELVKLRSTVIKVIINTSKELCPKISFREYLVPPEDTSILWCPISHHHSTLVSINELVETITDEKMYVLNENNQTVQLDQLIHFEPYANLGNRNLKVLFDSKDDNDVISDEVLYDIAEHAAPKYINEYYILFTPSCKIPVADKHTYPGNIQTLVEIFQLWKMQEGKICQFKQILNQFSIFAERNPFDYMSDKGILPY